MCALVTGVQTCALPISDAHVLIVGGGLLGLELAASLRESEIRVSIVQLSGRLMERQLDALSSSMLQDFVEEKWIRVFTHDQVQSIQPQSGHTSDTASGTDRSEERRGGKEGVRTC